MNVRRRWSDSRGTRSAPSQVSVPPVDMPGLRGALERVAPRLQQMRSAGMQVRRRLLWTSIYGPCHLADGEGGGVDAFATLMQVLGRRRRHFALSADHRAPRAPEMFDDLDPWLHEVRAYTACPVLLAPPLPRPSPLLELDERARLEQHPVPLSR